MPRRTERDIRTKDEVVRHLTEVAEDLDEVAALLEKLGSGLDPDRESADVERLDGIAPEPPAGRPEAALRAIATAYRRSAELAGRIEVPSRRTRRRLRRSGRHLQAPPAAAVVEEGPPVPF